MAAASLDDATASTALILFSSMKISGELIEPGTHIKWNGIIKRASVDLWDTEANTPDNAPALWADLDYHDGYRIISETIAVSTAFSAGEFGWWGDELYMNKMDSNVYSPAAYPDNWEKVQ